MALPTDRASFKQWCLRKLGSPVINIDVDDTQVDDRVDEALQKYADYHFDGADKIYYKHQITDTDVANKYITMPENILGVVKVYQPGSPISGGSDGLFNIQYQIALNDLYTLTSVSMVPYYMTRQHLELLNQILVGEAPIRYNRRQQKLFLDMDWSRVVVGQFLLVEAYEVVDPEQYADVWKDRWLLQYATALIKQQWGSNLKKFGMVQMPGGTVFNGQQIYDEATAEIAQMEADMLDSYSLPSCDLMG